MPKAPGRPRGALEREVLAALASSGRPLTAGEVQAEVGDVAYTTVTTTLTRLQAKGALSRALQGRAYVYCFAGPPDALDALVTARRMSRLLAGDEDRARVLARFVADLDPADEQLLADLLAVHPGSTDADPRP